MRAVTLKMGHVGVACFQNYWVLLRQGVLLHPPSRLQEAKSLFLSASSLHLHFCFETVQVATKARVTASESALHRELWMFRDKNQSQQQPA